MRAALVLGIFALAGVPALAEEAAAKILGVWQTAEKDAYFEVYEQGGKYFGKVTWMKEDKYPEGDKEAGVPKHDRENPDETLRDRPLQGLVFLKDFAYEGEGKYKGGTIYDPKSGKTYKCTLTLTEEGELKVRGYVGISAFGRTEVWTRAPER